MSKKVFRPWLIQRISWASCDELSPHKTSVDDYFRQDYMGAAEFEFGAMPGTLKLWREELRKSEAVIGLVTVANKNGDTVDLWVVMPKTTQEMYGDDIMEFWKKDALGEGPELKERTCLSNWDGEFSDNAVGWWTVDFGDKHHSPHGGTPWLFACFKERRHAEIWVHCLSNPKPVEA